MGAVKQKGGAVTIQIQYFGEKSLESSMKSVSKGGAAAPTSSAVDPPLTIDAWNLVGYWVIGVREPNLSTTLGSKVKRTLVLVTSNS